MNPSNFPILYQTSNSKHLEDGGYPIVATLPDGTTIGGDTQREVQKKVHDHRYENDTEYRKWWDYSMAKPLQIDNVTIPTTELQIGSVSMVGVTGTLPLSHGNYFNIHVPGFGGMGVINIWYENLKAAIDRFKPTELYLEIFNGGDGVIITAPEFPDDWMITELFIAYNCSMTNVTKHKVRVHKGLNPW